MAGERTLLFGRDAACRVILDAWGADSPGNLVIVGPAGVGRTRLAREALSLAEDQGRSTRWAAGTRAAAQVPFGAFAHLLPALDTGADTLALLQQATRVIVGDRAGPLPVLGVDDVHLLDPLSITLLHQLAAGGAVRLVLTVRTGNAVQDPAATLWKDGLATRIELQPLQREDADLLIGHCVGGQVHTRTVERLWRLSRGNPLYLHELVEDGLRTGRLRQYEDLWSWAGEMVPSQRLSEIVLAHVGDLDADEWRALHVLGTAGTCSVEQVVELSSPEAVAALERRGMIDDAGGSGEVQVAHPLYTEVVRSLVPEAARQRIRSRLARDQAAGGRDDHLLHRAAVLLDSGATAHSGALLTAGARHAVAQLDLPLAERLARAAVEEGGGFPAHATLVEAVRWQGRPALADRLAAAAAPAVRSDDDRARLAAARALTLCCGLGQLDQAGAVLRETRATVQDDGARALLTAAEAMLAFLGGDPHRAVQEGTTVLSAPAGAAHALAAAAVAAGLAVTGRTDQALTTVESGRLALDADPGPAERIHARVTLDQAEILALGLSGRFCRLERRAAELHRQNLTTTPEWIGDAIAGVHRGWAALASGRPRVASRWLAEALPALEERDPVGLLPLCRSSLAAARALVGDVCGARRLLDGSQPAGAGAVAVFDPLRRMAEAWVAAAEGRRGQAGVLVLEAAALAARQGQEAVEAVLLHDGLRLGQGPRIVDRLHRQAERLDAPFMADLAAHAAAAVAESAEGLDKVSSRFEQSGALLLAADAATEAASAYERRGERRAAAAARLRAATFARECGLTQGSALEVLPLPALTAREQEVARLASAGLSNQAIADRLVVSVRTVETHLSHAYTKLGISSRADLRAMLPTAALARS
ncbi:Response regulator containing a CheY-like receiver domain and an HTH DNA-binding domain [Geodermatophilus obscurus]|uniref:Response regulator containing a CheY-like receiver domain and an HTH DNA-binding domain n=1 Tax=Geodermatophilus obscurus TaxID=1861 RepID=A0A1M7TQC2_9ACTN|nr:LuxR family transcriptional regulator [Geodermatophilus obscurus]SHN72939.1 Response regulator containing a CheY-like receiver domain and an HTH DNA-binding domain [Geodermatophilus obscurus]